MARVGAESVWLVLVRCVGMGRSREQPLSSRSSTHGPTLPLKVSRVWAKHALKLSGIQNETASAELPHRRWQSLPSIALSMSCLLCDISHELTAISRSSAG